MPINDADPDVRKGSFLEDYNSFALSSFLSSFINSRTAEQQRERQTTRLCRFLCASDALGMQRTVAEGYISV